MRLSKRKTMKIHIFIAGLRTYLQQVRNHLYHLPEELLLEKPQPEKWSVKEILGHLTDSALYNLQRFNEISIYKGIYEMHAYQQDALVKSNRYQEKELSELMLLWQSLNLQICHVLVGLSEEALQKEVKVGDEMRTFDWLIEDYFKHLGHHITQLLAADKRKSKAIAYHISLAQAAQKLHLAPSEFVKLLEFGDLEVEYYQPNKVDNQHPHDKDELYIIASGHGEFVREKDTYHIQKNDVLFVKAGEVHRFVNFSDDFATWVIFYGLRR